MKLKSIFGAKKLPPPSSIMANQAANEKGTKEKHRAVILKTLSEHRNFMTVEQIAELSGLETAQVYRRMSELFTDYLVDKEFNSVNHGKTKSGVKCQVWKIAEL